MSFDDFFFYFPGYLSIPILLLGTLMFWLAYRVLSARRKQKGKPGPVENFPKT